MAQLNQSFTLANMIAAVRKDLLDLDPTNQRWTDDLLAREIDRALDRYSFVYPNFQVTQLPTITKSRLYPTPPGAWWVERTEYPLAQWPKNWLGFVERTSPLISPPAWPSTSPFSATATPGGTLSGSYLYALTFAVPGGETTPSATISLTAPPGSAVTLSNLPLGPYGVVDRKLYRTLAGGASLKLIQPIGDNTTVTFLDNSGDGQLGAAPPATNSTQNIPQFELLLNPSQLPQDTSGWIELTSAYKHTLDPTGTTIPEKHWDTIALGAQAFALFAYLTSTNDNLDYVDGQFRDRVDDSKAPAAWRAHAKELLAQFHQRLTKIRSEEQLSFPVENPRWGDRPVRWDRL